MLERAEKTAQEPREGFEPRIVALFCNWCTYMAADLAGTSRMRYAPNVRVVRVMCSGRIDPQFIMHAFSRGADGVLIGGCHPGDCHYQEGNYKALRRFRLLRRVIESLGIERERLRLEWISASEADRLRKVADEMAAEIRALGPLRLSIPAEDFLSAERADTEPPSLEMAKETAEEEVAVP
jgi:F420-non-reducing hydrogenase iron-sulfur subunit